MSPKIRWKRLALLLAMGTSIISFPIWYGWLRGGYPEIACVWEYDDGRVEKEFDADCYGDREGGEVVILKKAE
ncbi:MAG: hypothetical protein AAF329_00375 [Cyanobacteria bacterium P01_A01_bin.17]